MRQARPHRPELRGASHAHAKMGGWVGVCDPRVFCASKNPNFLARWRVRRRPAVRGPAGTGSVGDGEKITLEREGFQNSPSPPNTPSLSLKPVFVFSLMREWRGGQLHLDHVHVHLDHGHVHLDSTQWRETGREGETAHRDALLPTHCLSTAVHANAARTSVNACAGLCVCCVCLGVCGV